METSEPRCEQGALEDLAVLSSLGGCSAHPETLLLPATQAPGLFTDPQTLLNGSLSVVSEETAGPEWKWPPVLQPQLDVTSYWWERGGRVGGLWQLLSRGAGRQRRAGRPWTSSPSLPWYSIPLPALLVWLVFGSLWGPADFTLVTSGRFSGEEKGEWSSSKALPTIPGIYLCGGATSISNKL